jgi:hypothetical protein
MLLNAPRPLLYKQARMHPSVALGHTFVLKEFCVCGAKYIIALSLEFFIVFALVEPLASSLIFFIIPIIFVELDGKLQK